MNSIKPTATQSYTQRLITPVSEDQGHKYVKQKKETRARPEGKLARTKHQISTPKPLHEFRAELETVYGTRAEEIKPLDAPRAYRTSSSQSLPQDSKTHNQVFSNRAPHRSFAHFGYSFIICIVE